MNDLGGHNNQYSAIAVHLEGKLHLICAKPMNTHNLNYKKLEIKWNYSLNDILDVSWC